MRALACFAVAAALLAAPRAEARPRKRPSRHAPSSKKSPYGSLNVLVSVPGARVAVDNVEVGESPVKPLTGLKPGQHILKITKPGYSDYLETVKVSAGETNDQMVDLVALFAVLSVESNVPNALVTVDGKPIGSAPVRGKELTPGEHTVRVTAPGYKDFETTLKGAAGDPLAVRATLLPRNARPGEALASAEPQMELSLPPPKPKKMERATSPLVPPEETETTTAQPIYKKWWVWAVAGVVVAGAVGGTVAYSAGNSPAGPTADQLCGGKCDAVVHGIWSGHR